MCKTRTVDVTKCRLRLLRLTASISMHYQQLLQQQVAEIRQKLLKLMQPVSTTTIHAH